MTEISKDKVEPIRMAFDTPKGRMEFVGLETFQEIKSERDALSARVEEQDKLIATLSDQIELLEEEGCDLDTQLIHAEKQAFHNGRLQGLDEAINAIRCINGGWNSDEEYKHFERAIDAIEALKGAQP